MKKSEIGKFGEDAAAEYLISSGYTICERNYRKPYGEIDIIAQSPDGCLVFVEVKTRKNADYGYASEFVDKKKQQRLIRTAQQYCEKDVYMRFDIIEVYYKHQGNIINIREINHIEDAF